MVWASGLGCVWRCDQDVGVNLEFADSEVDSSTLCSVGLRPVSVASYQIEAAANVALG